MTGFTRDQLVVIRALRTIWSEETFVVVGAAAIGCHIDLRWRVTRDIGLDREVLGARGRRSARVFLGMTMCSVTPSKFGRVGKAHASLRARPRVLARVAPQA